MTFFIITPSNIVTCEELGTRMAILPIGDNAIELISPIGSKGHVDPRVTEHLRKRGEGLFHVCIFAEDFDTEVKTWKEEGYKVEVETHSAEQPDGTKINARMVFLSPEQTMGVLIEVGDLAMVTPDLFKSK